ncbi:MAG: hypothetical protein IJY21_03450 [Clostridia bacterium]|nr:hypothetical protein [Clostridia bacterium]
MTTNAQVKNKVGKRIWGVTWRVLCGVLAFLCTAVFAFVVVDRVRFHRFYKRAESTFAVPDIHSGYVPQGFDYDSERGVFLAAGYMSNGKPSRVYVMDGKGGEYHASLLGADGSAYVGHTGGIVHNGDYVYVTGDNGLDVFSYRDILDGKPTVAKCGEIRAYLNPAYCYIVDGYLLTGSFYRLGNYETADYERMTTPRGEQNTAIMTAFKLDESAEFGVDPDPCAVISTRGLVQGMCITDSGKIVLSTSYALAASKLYVYDSAKVQIEDGYLFAGETEDGLAFSYPNVKRVFLDGASHVDTVKAPCMSEELVYLNGKIYIMNESACNKYIFGKLTSGRKIYAYPYA